MPLVADVRARFGRKGPISSLVRIVLFLSFLCAGGYTLSVTEEAADSFGWTYLDVSPPRSEAMYTHLISQYNKFNREPWRRIESVASARLRVTGALLLYHFDRVPQDLKVSMLDDSLSNTRTWESPDRVAACIAYKCHKNGISVQDQSLVELGGKYWSDAGDSFGGVVPPPVAAANGVVQSP
jgi:hypothetical protein